MVWPTIKQSENTEMFKSKLRYQATFYITNKIAYFVKSSEMTSWWNSIVVLSMALHLYHMISTYTATLREAVK